MGEQRFSPFLDLARKLGSRWRLCASAILVLLSFVSARPCPAAAQSRALELPGPSQALFDHPYYKCVRNFYVGTTGSNTRSGTRPETAWQSLQHADDTGRRAGDCVNVLPGVYAKGLLITGGGKAAAPDGYVVYRCTVMDACTVTDVAAGGQNGAFVWDTRPPMRGNYVIIDGFSLRAEKQTVFGQGLQLWDGAEEGPQARFSVHHVWLLNSVIRGYGQSGVQMNDGEYFYVVHNDVYGNARAGCDAQGSGISFTVPKPLPGYARTPDDESNAIVGDIGTFNNVIAFNNVFLNGITSCGTAQAPTDTDGNDIIADTFSNAGSTNIAYPGTLLIAFNIVFNGGGGGIHLFRSANITVANNSCFNAGLDPFNKATYRPCIGDLDSQNNAFINNIAVARAGPGFLRYNAAFVGGNTGAGQPDHFTANISLCVDAPEYGCAPMHHGDVFSCATNQCDTLPGWRNVGNSDPGDEVTAPNGVDFALLPASPAIGRGRTLSFLPAQAADIGACPHEASHCGPKTVLP